MAAIVVKALLFVVNYETSEMFVGTFSGAASPVVGSWCRCWSFVLRLVLYRNYYVVVVFIIIVTI